MGDIQEGSTQDEEHQHAHGEDSGMEDEDHFDTERPSLLKKAASLRHANTQPKPGTVDHLQRRSASMSRCTTLSSAFLHNKSANQPKSSHQPCRISRMSNDSIGLHYNSEGGKRHLLEKATERMKSGMAGWQAKLIQRHGSSGSAYETQTVRRQDYPCIVIPSRKN